MQTRSLYAPLLLIGLSVAVSMVAAQDGDAPNHVFSRLKVGQAVNLTEDGGGYKIGVFETDVPLSHTLIEIGSDYVILRDVSEIHDVLIPVYSLKAIETIRLATE